MKKITMMAAVAVVAAGIFTACGSSTPKPKLKNEVDTLSYAMGLSQTMGLKEYLVQMDIDTTYIDEFLKGVNEGAAASDNKKKAAYYAGIQIGQQISTRMMAGINREIFGNDSTQSISLRNFMAGFNTGVRGDKGMMTVSQAQQVTQQMMTEMRSRATLKNFSENKKAGEAWMAANAKKEGVKTLPSGVQYKVLKEGKGLYPTDTSSIKVKYEGRLIDGTVFDSSYKRSKEPISLRANQVIKGWTEALVNMPAGSEWEIYVPQELAYGDRNMGQIKPFSPLIFKIELVEVPYGVSHAEKK